MPINNCQYTLLVITSSFSDPEKILKTLREADFMLLEASNQQEAIQRIRTTSPDLILLDIDKSVRQENTILQDFKTNKITGAIPVLFITSMTSENHIPECLNYDNIDFITKPFRRHFTRKVLVVGSASGGKTTLVKDLARTYNAPCSLEYAREYQEKYNVRDDELDTNDYIHLLTDQYAQTAEIIDNGQHSGLIFADTNSTVTKVYIDYYLKENISQEEFDMLDRLYQVTQAREKWDLIFVILPKSNYVDDGFRDMTMADNRTRDWFTKHLLNLLSPFKDKIVILGENSDSDSFFADNYHYAKKAIKERLHIEI